MKLLFLVVWRLDVPRSRVDPSELRFTQFNQSINKQLHETFCLFNAVVGRFCVLKCQPPQKTTMQRTNVVTSLSRIFLFEVKDQAAFESFCLCKGVGLSPLQREDKKTGSHSQEPPLLRASLCSIELCETASFIFPTFNSIFYVPGS